MHKYPQGPGLAVYSGLQYNLFDMAFAAQNAEIEVKKTLPTPISMNVLTLNYDYFYDVDL